MRIPQRGWMWAGLLVIVTLWATFAGRILYVNAPRHADVIVVLNGGTWARVTTGLRYLDQGWAPRLILDIDGTAEDWGVPEPELARQWIAHLPASESGRVSVCPSAARSTRSEARRVEPCLDGARSVLIVTSQYHTRRALSVFRREDPGRSYSVAGASEPAFFGVDWWRRREWAKTTFLEWLKLIWWEAVDRWR